MKKTFYIKRTRCIKKGLFLFMLLVSGFAVFSQAPDFISDSLDSYIRQGMDDWQVPGLSIVIVKDGKVVLMKGYGVKDIVSKEPVDGHTLFMIASNTKLFTATALSQLEYDKKISLDDKFIKYFPDFRLYEPTTTELVSIKDLLCHRIGTKTFQGDFTFWNSRLSSEEIMKKMRLLKPGKPFREDFGYCNSCFLSAGEIIPRVAGRQWAAYVRDSILNPLEMNNTYTSLKEIYAGTNAASNTSSGTGTNVASNPAANLSKAYTTAFTGTLQQLPLDNWDNLAPAAALLSNVSDLSHWLLFQLDSGRYNDQQIMPFDILQRTRDMNTVVTSRKSGILPTHMVGYGLGLFEEDYNGRQVFWHTGGASGMVSVVCFVPEERLGIAVLTNNDNQRFFVALRNQVLDAYLGVKYVNRSRQYFRGFAEEMKDSLKVIDSWKERAAKGAAPALPLSAYVGRYTDPFYGSLEIRPGKNDTEDGNGGKNGKNRLTITFNGHEHLTATLDYMDNGEWLMVYNNMEYGIFSTSFKIGNGKVVSITTKQNDEVEYDPYMFVKE